MRTIVHLTASDARRMPWKNGRGVTEELACWPVESTFERGDFDWRVSKAHVDAAGAFSSFPGFERILVVTRGAGLMLRHGDGAPRVRLRPLEPYAFAGELATAAELVDGSIADFNVFARRGVVEASVEVLQLGIRRARDGIGAGHALTHVLAGSATARVTNEEDAFELECGDSLWGRELRDADELELAGRTRDCCVILVRIARAR